MISMLDARTFVRCEKNWVKAKIPIREKVAFLIRQIISLAGNKRRIKYLGKKFNYDRKFEPILISEYPAEIEGILSFTKPGEIKTVIDVGANAGQWGLTMARIGKGIEVHSFEPNPKVFSLLEKNSEGIKNWKVYNYGIGRKEGEKNLYYSQHATAEGSFIKENLEQNTLRSGKKEARTKLLPLNKKTLRMLKIEENPDLVKIDVEGYEMECLKGMKGLNFKYLYIEASINRQGATIKDILEYLNKNLKKKTQVLFRELPDKDSKSENVMIKIIK
jgi:FkbM family methyltransferase